MAAMTNSAPLLPMPRKCLLRSDTRAGSGFASRIDPALGRAQSYRIVLNSAGANVTAADEAGAFYAQQTLGQLRRVHPEGLPQGEIEDSPDFAVRGVMLDISRDKVPTMATLFSLVDLFAELKINQLQLYTEHTFAYANHPDVWRDASPMTAAEIRELDAYCKARHIELVPNQNSFGHLERWLKHPRYEPLAEKPDGFTFPWGTKHEGGFSLNPLDPRSLELIESLYDELLPNFSSRLFNVGCDETHDVGLGKSKAECDARGKERVYLEFLLKIYQAVKRRGRTMQFWGDIVLHHPQLIGELPNDAIALNWGYDGNHPFENETRAFADAKVPFYVCPGTSSWLSISGRTHDALENCKKAAACGLANGAIGYLNTDWGDLGHWQYLPISYLGFAAGAAFSWCCESNKDLDIASALSAHVFHDRANVMGRLMHDFGNVYQAVKTPMGNSTRLFWSFHGGEARRKLWEVITREEFADAESRLNALEPQIDRAQMDRPDAQLIKDELRNAFAMLRFGCRRGKMRLDQSEDRASLARDMQHIIAEHKRLWLARNRPGGLKDSVGRMEKIIAQPAAPRSTP